MLTPVVRAFACLVVCLFGVAQAMAVAAATPPEDAVGPLAAPLERAVAEAETALRAGEVQVAESRYRTALVEGWLALGTLDAAAGDLAAARDAFETARTASVETRRAVFSLALVHLQLAEPERAVELLRDLLGRLPGDPPLRRLLAQALVAAGQTEQAMQELEEAVDADPDDLESAFALATGYLRQGRPQAAKELFERVAAARPLPETWVLIGRTYRDFELYDAARAALDSALALDPRAHHAHYYLGTIDLMADGQDGLDAAIGRFQRELETSSGDPVVNLFLGMALVEQRRFEEALAPLRAATGAAPTRRDGLHQLGRALLGLDRSREAIEALRSVLELASGGSSGARPASGEQLAAVHYQLALALRRSGDEAAATHHFAEAERFNARLTEAVRDRLARYLGEAVDAEKAPAGLTPHLDVSPLAALDATARQELRRRLDAGLARAYLNLGVLQAQAQRPQRAERFFAAAAGVDADFPRVQYSLGVTSFRSGHFAAAVAPLARALEQDPADDAVRRMLALARLNSGDPAGAADLLRDDEQRLSDPSLAYAYGLALVESGRAAEAESAFSDLLAHHADWPELHLVLGRAHAQQGDYPAAQSSLRRALALDPGVAGAHATLGEINLRQGHLDDAETELRQELRAHPRDRAARYTLATVLDLNQRSGEAAALLRELLAEAPDHADARYLLGKILLAGGDAEAAAAQLEAAAGLSPRQPEIRYQLAQAYQKLGRTAAAQQQFDAFRELKAERRQGDG